MADPYVYENTNVLINLKDIKDQTILDEYESTMANLALIKLYKSKCDISSVFSVFDIHKTIFEKVYSWAGEKRSINIYKQEEVLAGLSVEYSKASKIEEDLTKIDKEYSKINWNLLSKEKKIEKIVKITSSIWQVHPFREGNTRVISVFIFFLMRRLNLDLDNQFLADHAKFFRNALVLSSIGQYSEYNHLESILSAAASNCDSTNKNSEKYSSINGYDLKNYRYTYHTAKEN